MRRLLAILSMAVMGWATGVSAQSPVVLELYTSQGCSSCPPADKLLHDLAKRDDVIALALHVDYWDYIGWKDEFADPRHTERQKGYARAAGAMSIYTPQMVIAGQDHVIGTKPGEVTAHLNAHAAKAALVEVSGDRRGNRLTVRAEALKRLPGEVNVFVVTYRPSSTVRVRRGENAGRTLDYANVVTSWTEAKSWNGRGAYELSASINSSSDPAVILFQRAGHREILGAIELR